MATLLAELKGKLENESSLTFPPLGFTIYDYWITPGRPASAFDAANGNRLRRSIVIMDGGEVDHPSPHRSDWRLWDSNPQFYIYAEAHANGKLAVRGARLIIEQLLAPWRCNADEGRNITFLPDDVQELDDSELFPGNLVHIVRWRATGARALAQRS